MGKSLSQSQDLVIRRLLVIIIAALLIWGAVVIGISGIARSGNPELALRLSPTDSRAMTYLADRLLIKDPTAVRAERPLQLARAALLNDPTNVAALRILGFSAPPAEQRAIFELSNRLSRRDLATQLWLIDYHVGREDAPSALAHYDAALRTSTVAPQLLFPVLAQASGDVTLAPQIGDVLASNPPWANAFLTDLLFSSPSADTLLTIFKTVSRGGFKLQKSHTDGLTARMLRDYRFDLLREAFFVARGADKAVGGAVTNGGFEAEPALLPFDWMFAPDGAIFAGRSKADSDAGGARMAVQTSDGAGGAAARQLLMLPAGRYSLSSTSGSVPPARLSWRVTCATKTGAQLHDMALPTSTNAGKVSKSEFSVPSANCAAQWLSMQVTPQTGGEEMNAWIDDVTVKALK